jgi:DNA polymerase-3 subunit epsilon
MTKLLIVDLETTGLTPGECQVIELGAILYSVPYHCVIQQLSTLFPVLENPAEVVNRISADASVEACDRYPLLLQVFQQWVEDADYLVAHNAEFDRQWFGQAPLPAIHKPWLCTYQDFIWPMNLKPVNLVTTALNHGIGVSAAHRALTDCQLIAALFDRVEAYQSGQLKSLVEQAIQRSQEPTLTIIAQVSYANRDLAKAQDFRWNSETRQWIKQLRRSDLEKEQPLYPFQITIESTSPNSNYFP